MSLSPYFPGQLWLYRTKPQEDELFSSWMVRLAWGMGLKLQSFTTAYLKQSPGFWTQDVDKDISMDLAKYLATTTGGDKDRILQTVLASYETILWESFSKTQLSWVLSIGKYGRKRRRAGQQFCRQCLLDDEMPFFRKKWRLAFNVLCEEHRIYLSDRCGQCSTPVEFHRGDYGKDFPYECPNTICPNCACDYRNKNTGNDREAGENLIRFQTELNELLDAGRSDFFPGARSHSHLFFEGLRYLVGYLTATGHVSRLREYMLKQKGQLGLTVLSNRPRPVFEELCIGDRIIIMELVCELLENWPVTFVETCIQSRISSSYLIRYEKALPFWLDFHLRWHLNDKDYCPSQMETESVRQYLINNGLSCSVNNIRKYLGLSYSPLIGEKQYQRRKRWNPRGGFLYQ